MLAEIYEYEMSFIRLGQTVEITSQAYPSEKFTGTISFISPTLNEATRTVNVRVDVPNPVRNPSDRNLDTNPNEKMPIREISNGANADRKLKPAMFVNASIKIP